jgi:hypothetical protein
MRKTILIWSLFLCICSQSSAQVVSMSPINGVNPAVFNAAGGTYDNATSYFRFEWSFGELVVTDAMAPADSAVLVTHGVLQPCTEFTTKYPMTVLFEKDDYKILPNPTKGQFEVNFFVRTPGKMRIQLSDQLGRILERREFYYTGCCRIEKFDLSRYPDGAYYVIADLEPDEFRGDIFVIRHGGLKIIKLK